MQGRQQGMQVSSLARCLHAPPASAPFSKAALPGESGGTLALGEVLAGGMYADRTGAVANSRRADAGCEQK